MNHFYIVFIIVTQIEFSRFFLMLKCTKKFDLDGIFLTFHKMIHGPSEIMNPISN